MVEVCHTTQSEFHQYMYFGMVLLILFLVGIVTLLHINSACTFVMQLPSCPSLSYVQVVNLPVHSHCPLFHTIYRMGTLLLTLPLLRVTWMYVKSYSHDSPHELHSTSLIFDFVYIASTRHAQKCDLENACLVRLCKTNKNVKCSLMYAHNYMQCIYLLLFLFILIILC